MARLGKQYASITRGLIAISTPKPDPIVSDARKLWDKISIPVPSVTVTTDVMRPAIERITRQWDEFFGSLGKIKRSIYPDNLFEVDPSLTDVENIVLNDGIPLMWVPRADSVRRILEVGTARARRQVIKSRWKGIVSDCEEILRRVSGNRLAGDREFALSCVAAMRSGHTDTAQALAGNLLDTMMIKYFEKDVRERVTKNKVSKPTFNPEDYKARFGLTFAPVWFSYAHFWAPSGDPIPRFFSRNASVHAVSRHQYNRVNATIALMLISSILAFFDDHPAVRPS